MQIRELETEEEMIASLLIIQELYPDMSAETYATFIAQKDKQSYRMIGMFDGDECIAVCGFRVGIRLYCGSFIHVDNMAVRKEYRSQGIGSQFFDWIREEGKRLGCKNMVLDTLVENKRAHQLFFKEGMVIRGYHFGEEI